MPPDSSLLVKLSTSEASAIIAVGPSSPRDAGAESFSSIAPSNLILAEAVWYGDEALGLHERDLVIFCRNIYSAVTTEAGTPAVILWAAKTSVCSSRSLASISGKQSSGFVSRESVIGKCVVEAENEGASARGMRPVMLVTERRRLSEGEGDDRLLSEEEQSESVSRYLTESVTILKPSSRLEAGSKTGDCIWCDPSSTHAGFKT